MQWSQNRNVHSPRQVQKKKNVYMNIGWDNRNDIKEYDAYKHFTGSISINGLWKHGHISIFIVE